MTLLPECNPDKERDTRSSGLRGNRGTGFHMGREGQSTTFREAGARVTQDLIQSKFSAPVCPSHFTIFPEKLHNLCLEVYKFS